MEALSIEEREERIEEIVARRTQLDKQYAGQQYPPEVRDEWNALKEEEVQHRETIDELRVHDEDLREAAADPERQETSEAPKRTTSRANRGDDVWDMSTLTPSFADPERSRNEVIDRALRAVDQVSFPHPRVNREDAQEHVANLVRMDESGDFCRRILATGRPTYLRAFAKSCAGQTLTGDEQRALSLGTPKAGAGLAVPFTLDPTVIPTSNSVVNPIRAIARVVTITDNDEWRGITSTAVTAQYRAEAAPTTDNSPTITQPSVRVQRADTFVPFSRELGMDWGALVTELTTLFGEAKDDLESAQFYNGAGTTVFPQGVFTGLSATQRVAPATNGAFVVGDLYLLGAAIPPRHQTTSSYVGNIGFFNRIRAFDTNGTLYTTLPSAVPGQLMGLPAYQYSTVPNVLTINSPYLIAGNFSRYIIVDRVGMEVEVIPHMFDATTSFPTNQRGLLAFWRNSAIVADANAFRYLASTA